MVSSNYFHLSEACKSIKGDSLASQDLKAYYDQLSPTEQFSLVNHFIIGNPPYAFRAVPLLFDQILQYIGEELQVGIDDIKLVGSATLGYSIAPKQFGKVFSDKSDMDFTIIDQNLFRKLEEDFRRWRDEYQANRIAPKNSIEERYWKDNISRLPINISRGFVDLHLLPTLSAVCPTRIRIGEALSRVKANMESYGIITSRLSLRIYKDYPSFYKQLMLNTNKCMKEL